MKDFDRVFNIAGFVVNVLFGCLPLIKKDRKGGFWRNVRLGIGGLGFLFVFFVLVISVLREFAPNMVWIDEVPLFVYVLGCCLTLGVMVYSFILVLSGGLIGYKEKVFVERTSYRNKNERDSFLIGESKNAKNIVILGGDGSFLVQDDGSSSEQFGEIAENKSRYKILFNKKLLDSVEEKVETLGRDGEGGMVRVRRLVEGVCYGQVRGRVLDRDPTYSMLLCEDLDNGRFGLLHVKDSRIVKLVYDYLMGYWSDKGSHFIEGMSKEVNNEVGIRISK